jgi:hypothetical protein
MFASDMRKVSSVACPLSVVLSGYSNTKTGRHDIAETLLKVALSTKKKPKQTKMKNLPNDVCLPISLSHLGTPLHLWLSYLCYFNFKITNFSKSNF